MAKTKSKVLAFSSDWHFNHYDYDTKRGIITFERNQFDNIKQHDQAIVKFCEHWSERWAADSEFWFLGDFGDLSYLWVFDLFAYQGIKIHFLLGNHDHKEDIDKIKKHVDYVHEYPVFLSQKLVVSHFPVAVYEDTINIHGHLHSSKLQDINHINANIHVAQYQPIDQNKIAAVWSKLPKFNRRFLYEPWANDYKFIQKKEDVIMDYDGNIDLSASRLLQKLNSDNRQEKNDPYNPYTGGLNVR